MEIMYKQKKGGEEIMVHLLKLPVDERITIQIERHKAIARVLQIANLIKRFTGYTERLTEEKLQGDFERVTDEKSPILIIFAYDTLHDNILKSKHLYSDMEYVLRCSNEELSVIMSKTLYRYSHKERYEVVMDKEFPSLKDTDDFPYYYDGKGITIDFT